VRGRAVIAIGFLVGAVVGIMLVMSVVSRFVTVYAD
jgi:tetrahydromethanopterin S-methyltransferase subunit G